MVTITISVLITLVTVFLTPYLINLLFVGGRFTATDAAGTLHFIPYFILPAIGWGINNIFFQPLLALKKQKELGILNLSAFILAWLVGIVVNNLIGAEMAISAGLLTLLFTGIIGSELLWQHFRRSELKSPMHR